MVHDKKYKRGPALTCPDSDTRKLYAYRKLTAWSSSSKQSNLISSEREKSENDAAIICDTSSKGARAGLEASETLDGGEPIFHKLLLYNVCRDEQVIQRKRLTAAWLHHQSEAL